MAYQLDFIQCLLKHIILRTWCFRDWHWFDPQKKKGKDAFPVGLIK